MLSHNTYWKEMESTVLILKYILFISVQFGYVISSPKPHILFILADDLGWNDVSWHNPSMLTPTLDKMARKGVILDSSYVTPSCSPSRGALMSGYYPFHLGMQHGVVSPAQAKFLPADVTTLPTHLKELGYATHLIGKWHLGYCNWKYTPTYRGFDSFFGFYAGAQDYYKHKRADGRDFRWNTTAYTPPRKYSTSLFANQAIDIIHKHDEEQSPLFMFLSFQGVHSPLQVPKPFTKKYSHVKNKNRRIYNGMVTALDEAVKKVMNAMRIKKFTKNLLVVFLSDNGGASYISASNWPLRGCKTTLWEGGTRVPSFVYSRNLLKKKGYVNKEMIHAVDWLPTLVKIAGGKPNPKLDGVNQWPMLSRGLPSARSEFVYNINEIKGNGAIRMGDYKLIYGRPGKYNGWYPAPTRPECDAVKNGYDYTDEEKEIEEDDKKSFFGVRRLNSVFKHMRKYLFRAAKASGVVDVWSKWSKWYKRYKCSQYKHARELEEKSYQWPQIQLYNLKKDPLEKYNLARKKPLFVRKLMRRLKLYRKTLVPAQNPGNSREAKPRFHNRTWSPGWC